MKRMIEFKYKKKDDNIEDKNVSILNDAEKYITAIDLSKLTEEDREELINANNAYEEKIAPFVKKGFRRYFKENMLFAEEDKIDV